MLKGFWKVCRAPRSFATSKTFFSSPAPEIAITLAWRNSRVSSRSMSSPYQFGHDNVCDNQIRRPVAVQRNSDAAIGSLNHRMPCRFKREAEEGRMGSSSSMIKNCRHDSPTGICSRFRPCTARRHRGAPGQVTSGHSSDEGLGSKMDFVILIVQLTPGDATTFSCRAKRCCSITESWT